MSFEKPILDTISSAGMYTATQTVSCLSCEKFYDVFAPDFAGNGSGSYVIRKFSCHFPARVRHNRIAEKATASISGI